MYRILLSMFLSFLCSLVINAQLSVDSFSLEKVPFSYRGAYTVFYSDKNSDDLYLKDVSRKFGRRMVAQIQVLNDTSVVPSKFSGSPEMIRYEKDKRSVQICYENKNTIRMMGKGYGLRLTVISEEDALQPGPCTIGTIYIVPDATKEPVKQFRIYRYWNIRYMYSLLKGKNKVRKVNNSFIIDIYPENNSWDLVLEEFESEWKPREYTKSFETCANESKTVFNNWLQKMPVLPDSYAEAGALANYIDWSALVAPRHNLLTREGMLSSKWSMDKIWSWDHCFPALGLSGSMPELAWDQIMVIFDHQDELGAIPNSLNDYYIHWGIFKPPIHGFIYKKLMETNKYFLAREQLTKAYEILGKWTDFWMLYRDDDKNGIPQYNDGGSDSGWDNGTAFDNYLGYAVESPDLCAYLVVQMDVLSEIASKLNNPADSKLWKKRADELLDKFIKRLWTGDQFVVKKTGSDIYETQNRSLIGYIPIILGNRLPKDIKAKLIADLRDNKGLLTQYGFATEHPESPFYKPDGYWRGPIWTPTTLFMVEGLNDCGEKEFAKDVAKRFCDMCVKNGFAENFEATTGTSLRNPAYTWSSSIFIFLAHKYLIK